MNWDGLAAESCEFFDGDAPGTDLEFYREIVERGQGRALDIGCCIGRLTNRFLQAGLPIEGVDTSADVLAVCRERAERQGLRPVLHNQAMQSLDLPGQYRTILVPSGTFQLLTEQSEALEALRRFHAHLEPGGMLALTIIRPRWNSMHDERQQELPGEWSVKADHTRSQDGARFIMLCRPEGMDRIRQVGTQGRRYQLFHGETLVREDPFALHVRWYGIDEMRLMLISVGFQNIRVTGEYGNENVTDRHTTWMFRAEKR